MKQTIGWLILSLFFGLLIFWLYGEYSVKGIFAVLVSILISFVISFACFLISE